MVAKIKKLTKGAIKLLKEAGCNEIGEGYVVLGTTDLRILLSDEAIADLNAQVRQLAQYKR